MSDPNDDPPKPEIAEVEPTPEGEGASSPSTSPAKKKKKKRKRAAGDGAELEPELVLDVSGAERAAFFAWFPRDPELDRLVRAFEIGNYALVRQQAPELAERAESDKVRAAARELLARIEPDPLMKYLLAAAVVLLLFISFYAYRVHSH